MSAIPWIMIAIGVLIILFAVIAIYDYKKKGKKHETDYYTFFIIGIIWTIFGIIFYEEMSLFLIIGIAFMIMGLVNKDKWKKNRKTWKNMDKTEKKIMIWALIIGSVLFLIGLVAYFLVRNGIIG